MTGIILSPAFRNQVDFREQSNLLQRLFRLLCFISTASPPDFPVLKQIWRSFKLQLIGPFSEPLGPLHYESRGIKESNLTVPHLYYKFPPKDTIERALSLEFFHFKPRGLNPQQHYKVKNWSRQS